MSYPERTEWEVELGLGHAQLTPDYLIRATGLSSLARMLLQTLYTYRSESGKCCPSQETLCEKLGISKPTLLKVIRELEKKYVIKVHRGKPGKDKKQPVNQYELRNLDRNKLPSEWLASGVFGEVGKNSLPTPFPKLTVKTGVSKETLQEHNTTLGISFGEGDTPSPDLSCDKPLLSDQGEEKESKKGKGEWSPEDLLRGLYWPSDAPNEPVSDHELNAALPLPMACDWFNRDSPSDEPPRIFRRRQKAESVTPH